MSSPNQNEIQHQRALDLAQQQDRVANQQQANDEGQQYQANQQAQIEQETAEAEQMAEQEEMEKEQQPLFNKKPEDLTDAERKYLLDLAKKRDSEAFGALEKAISPQKPFYVDTLNYIADGFDTIASAISWLLGFIPLIGTFLGWLIKGIVKIPTTLIRALATLFEKAYRAEKHNQYFKATKEAKYFRKIAGEKKDSDAEKEANKKADTVELWPGGAKLPKWNLRLAKYVLGAAAIAGGVTSVGSSVGVVKIMCSSGNILLCGAAIIKKILSFFGL